MKSTTFSLFLLLLSVGLFVVGCGGGAQSVDMGDGSLGFLVWSTYQYGFVDEDLDRAMAQADKALELYGDEARLMQDSLSGFPPTEPPEATYKYNVLNNVGSIVLAKGEFLLKKGDRGGAEEAFNMLIQDFGYAQIDDRGEWKDYASSVPRDARGFMKLTDVAELRLADIKAGKD